MALLSYERVKRVLDVSIAVVALILAAPLWLAIAAWIRLDSPGPVLYRGRRIGRHGLPTLILKFRTMRPDADKLGGASTSSDDPRVTRVGHVLRRYKLDEMPQLLNVLRGDMSLVGPRPEVFSERDTYTGEYAEILALRPGITDWASIWNIDEGAVLAGAADPHEAYRRLIQPTKLALQLKYAREVGLATDLRILASTVLRMIRPEWTPADLRALQAPGRAHLGLDPQSPVSAAHPGLDGGRPR